MSSRSTHFSRIHIYWQKFLPWLESCAITAWGIVLTKLWLFGQLFLLVHPNYIPLTAIAGLGLIAIGVTEAWRVSQRRRNTATSANIQQHVTLIKPSLSSSLLLIVAIAALLINPRPFTSEKAIHRGVIDNIADARTVPKSFRASNRPEERTLVEWVRTISAYPEPDAYKGQKVKLTGFVVHAPDQPDNEFLIMERVAESRKVDEVPASRLLSDWEVASLGVTRSIISNAEKTTGGKIAFLFLTEGPLPLERLWSRFFDVGHLYHSQHSQALLLP